MSYCFDNKKSNNAPETSEGKEVRKSGNSCDNYCPGKGAMSHT